MSRITPWAKASGLSASVDSRCRARARRYSAQSANTFAQPQITGDAFTGTLKDDGITVSLDGKGRCMDDIAKVTGPRVIVSVRCRA
jgi:hypothetical protein